MPELIIIEENQKISYFQKCKIEVNGKKKSLFLSPDDEMESIAIKFGENCYQKSKYLSLFPSAELTKSYVLIFLSDLKCKEIYDIIKNPNAEILGETKLFEESIFAPILCEIKSNPLAHPRLTEIIADFIDSLNLNERKPFMNAIKNANLEKFFSELNLNDNNMHSKIADIPPSFPTSETIIPPHMKEPSNIADIEKIEESPALASPARQTINLEKAPSKREFRSRKRPLAPKTYSAEDGCNELDKEEVDESYEESNNESDENDIPCKKQKWSSRNAFETILESNTYEIVNYEIFGEQKTKLILSTSIEKNFCYEYSWESSRKHRKYFVCGGCRRTNKKFVAAIKSLDDDGLECIKINGTEHVCEPIEYNSENYKSDLKIFSPNFELTKFKKSGIENEYIIIFTSNERKLCYEFVKHESKRFYCVKCRTKNNFIPACICTDQDGNEYVSIKNREHICEPFPYIPNKELSHRFITFNGTKISIKFEQILEFSNYKIISYQLLSQPRSRLILFSSNPENMEDEEENQLCYNYIWDPRLKYFYCRHCETNTQKKFVGAIYSRDENGNECIKVNTLEHVCDLVEYKPEKYKSDIKLYPPNYEIKNCKRYGIEKKNLIIFTSEKKKYCYEFGYLEERKRYFCEKCHHKKLELLALIFIDEEGKEYASVRNIEHICEPIEYNPEKYMDHEIIKAPDFKFYETHYRGKMVQKIAIFTDENRKLCYEFRKVSEKRFICEKCAQKKTSISAKLFSNVDGEDCIQLSDIKHVCEPKTYVGDNPIFIRKPNFNIFRSKTSKSKPSIELNIFHSKNQNLCYIYNLHGKYFVCNDCQKLKKHVAAGMLEDENGEGYVELFNTEHICKLKKYVEFGEEITDFKMFQNIVNEKLQKTKNPISSKQSSKQPNNNFKNPESLSPEKVVKHPYFLIDSFTKSDGTKIQQLTIFDQSNLQISYIYNYQNVKKIFQCNACKKESKAVTAKLHQNKNPKEAFLELNVGVHVCISQPNEKTFQNGEFEIKKDKDGKFSKLIIFDSENKNFCYHFVPLQHENLFRCQGCYQKTKKYYQAKIFQNDNGEYYVKMENFQHVCNSSKNAIEPKIE